MGSTPLYDALRAFAAQRPLRMHMPGHKGKPLPAPELAAIAAALAKPTAEQRAAALDKENVRLKAQVQALSDRGEFMEDCLAEMAAVVYG